MKNINQLDRLFNPATIAVIGASDEVRKGGGRFVKGLLEGSFEGGVFPVNPGRSELMGLKCYPRV